MENKQINQLFKTRDKAVKTQDGKLFLSTQIGEIKDSLSAGYLSADKMVTEVIVVDLDEGSELTKIVIAKETYFSRGKKSHSGFLIYYLVNTVEGWKIYKIVY